MSSARRRESSADDGHSVMVASRSVEMSGYDTDRVNTLNTGLKKAAMPTIRQTIRCWAGLGWIFGYSVKPICSVMLGPMDTGVIWSQVSILRDPLRVRSKPTKQIIRFNFMSWRWLKIPSNRKLSGGAGARLQNQTACILSRHSWCKSVECSTKSRLSAESNSLSKQFRSVREVDPTICAGSAHSAAKCQPALRASLGILVKRVKMTR
jgi:hypothetical protein